MQKEQQIVDGIKELSGLKFTYYPCLLGNCNYIFSVKSIKTLFKTHKE